MCPIEPDTWDGFKLFMTFLEDYIYFFMVHLLETKSEAGQAIQDYLAQVEAFTTRATKIRYDNAECISNKIRIWSKGKGLIWITQYYIPSN